jgi:cyclopropane fatty-acyl-phospholipid synthase-like methyltransferase
MHFFQMESDDFFATGYLKKLGIQPDVAFIDGMHHFEYALRDFINCEASMTKNGTVMLHDVLPTTFSMATRAMSELEASRPWTGDVWKVVVALLDHRPDLELHVLDCYKTGLCAIRGLDPNNTTLHDNFDAILAMYIDMDLSDDGPESYFSRFPLEAARGFSDRVFG